jgi:hypothetical protein
MGKEYKILEERNERKGSPVKAKCALGEDALKL